MTPFLYLLPILLGAVLNYISLHYQHLKDYRIPIHAGLFGQNKTWAGLALLVIWGAVGGLITWALNILYLGSPVFADPFESLRIGAILGLAWAVGELPNSYLKRRFGIGSGELGRGPKAILFSLFNQFDSPISCGVFAYFFCYDISLGLTLQLIGVGGILHFVLNTLLYFAKVRKQLPF
jgi:hypothetical protein